MAFAPIPKGSALPDTALGQLSNDAAGFASCYGPLSRSPKNGLSTLGFDPAHFPWRLPGPDSHRQATTSRQHKINHLHGQPPVRWAHENAHYGRPDHGQHKVSDDHAAASSAASRPAAPLLVATSGARSRSPPLRNPKVDKACRRPQGTTWSSPVRVTVRPAERY